MRWRKRHSQTLSARRHRRRIEKCPLKEPCMDALEISESKLDRVCIVSLTGRIDSSNAERLMSRLKELIASGEKSILIDLQGVLYLTSAAFRVLLVATDEAERNAARLELCSVVGYVRELFEM